LEVRETRVVSKTAIHHDTFARVPVVGSHKNSNWRRNSRGNLGPISMMSIELPCIAKVDVIAANNSIVKAFIKSSEHHQSFVNATKNSSRASWGPNVTGIGFSVPFGFFGTRDSGDEEENTANCNEKFRHFDWNSSNTNCKVDVAEDLMIKNTDTE